MELSSREVEDKQSGGCCKPNAPVLSANLIVETSMVVRGGTVDCSRGACEFSRSINDLDREERHDEVGEKKEGRQASVR